MKNEIETNLKIDANVEDFDNTPKMLKPMELGDERFKKEVLWIQDKYNLWGEMSFEFGNEKTNYYIALQLGFRDYYNNPIVFVRYNTNNKTIKTNIENTLYYNFKLYKNIHHYIIEVIELIERTESN
jgi:hypothetical protein